MASTHEIQRAMRRAALLFVFTAAVACRAGLPPEPPGHDAAEAEAEIPAYAPSRDPLSTSAFEGVQLQGGGHGHHHHGGSGSAPAGAAADTSPREEAPR